MFDNLPQPYDVSNVPAAQIGHNSRAFEIRKAAEELRQIFLRKNLNANDIPHECKVIFAASISPDLSAEAFRQLVIHLGIRKCRNEGVDAGPKPVALLLNCSERTVRRWDKELESEGWIAMERRRRAPAERIPKISQKVLDLIAYEVVSVSRSGAEAQDIVVPHLAVQELRTIQDRPFLAGQEIKSGQNAAEKAAISGQSSPSNGIGIYNKNNNNNMAREEAIPIPALVEDDFRRYNALFKIWGKKAGHFFEPMGGITREFSDDNLIGAIDAVSGHDPGDVIEAAKMTILSLDGKARTNPSDNPSHGCGGFGNYFQQALRTTVAKLVKQRRANAARGSPQSLGENLASDEKRRRELKALGVKL